jgi:eukaryotic-like serine/threonine-protein kinase
MTSVVEASLSPSKVCAACGGRFPSDALFCPTDGTALQSAAAAEREVSDPYLGQELAGHIEIRQLVGVGAMGRVYRAFQRGIDRDVAVKILHRELSANAQLVSRFTREAKVASRLQHPNVVQVLLAGQLADRALYMVMEYLDGMSLQSALAAAGGSLPLSRALHIALQLCEAVGEAHAQGIVHRDLKPENVMLVRRGSDPDFVKVLDFGIARINWGEQSVATAAGLIFGTARYISPEGAQGNAVGPASDVYAIGTLLYQMLAGRTPFDGDQAVGLLVQQIHDPAPPLRSIARAAYVPEPIADVVMATLAKDPTKREQDARALGHAIFDAARLSGLSPEEFSRPQRRRESAMKLPPVERTKQLELTPEIEAKIANGDIAQKKPTAATVKWEPPSEFQARLTPSASVPTAPVADTPRARIPSNVDATIDDLGLDPSSAPFFPAAPSVPEGPKTVPGDSDARISVRRTDYTPPIPETSRPTVPTAPPLRSQPPPKRRALWIVLACFVFGAALAAGAAWRAGRLGPASDESDRERWLARASDAMFKNRFHEPPGENVKDLTDEGLRRWPNDRRLLDVRTRAATELVSQAMAQRSGGDVLEALRLARVAHELDSQNASAKRLVDQYEAELASFSPPAAPTLARPAERPQPSASGKPGASVPARVETKALLDISAVAPRIGQTVELVGRVAPPRGDFTDPAFTIAGPGPAVVRLPAQPAGPGTFKASYAFLEGGKYDITFTTQVEGKAVAAKRSITAGGAPPTPPPQPTPSATGSVKWM